MPEALKKSINEAIAAAEALRNKLQAEQEESENVWDDWNEDDEESRGDEPEIIVNDDVVNSLSRTINLLEKAIDELDEATNE